MLLSPLLAVVLLIWILRDIQLNPEPSTNYRVVCPKHLIRSMQPLQRSCQIPVDKAEGSLASLTEDEIFAMANIRPMGQLNWAAHGDLCP